MAKSYLNYRIRFKSGLSPALMVTTLTSKQAEHMRTLLILAEHRNDHDILLVARAALEGMALLRWAMKDPEVRCKSWRNFACVTELRKSIAFEKRGGRISEGDWQRMEGDLAERCDEFVKNNELGVLSSERYKMKWADYSARRIFKEIGAETYYDVIYEYASEWTHSSAYPVVTATSDEEPGYQLYRDAEPRFLMASLAAGFVSLFHTLEVLQSYFYDQFYTNEREELSGLRTRFERIETGLGLISRN